MLGISLMMNYTGSKPNIKYTVNFSAMGYQHISFGDGNRLPVGTDAVLAAT
jgi:hypothetical protein